MAIVTDAKSITRVTDKFSILKYRFKKEYESTRNKGNDATAMRPRIYELFWN
jgi:hypothetical protein